MRIFLLLVRLMDIENCFFEIETRWKSDTNLDGV